jgi:glycosyltransferase involved in cell wall biosynthesis
MNMPDDEIEYVKRADNSAATFSILIPSWNNLPYLQLCISSIFKNSVFQHQILVHINEGTDGSKEWIESQMHIDFTYSNKNIGVCYALNALAGMADTDYILYMNDDMYACPGWDKILYDEIQSLNSKYFFLSATAIEPVAQSKCSIEKNYGTDISSFNETVLLNEFASLPFNDWQGATWPPNVVHKDVWHIVGGYSIEFSPGMYSDPDFSMKLWSAGIRYFKGLSKSRVYHFGSKSVKRITKNPGYYTFISKWGFTSSTVTSYFLKRGNLFDGALPEVTLSASLKMKSLFKKIVAAIKR